MQAVVETNNLMADELVLRSLAGDRRAFERLVQLYSPRLLCYVRRLLSDHDLAEDVLQNVWLSVYQQLPRLRSTNAFHVWIYRIARNQAYMELRRNRRHAREVSLIEDLAEELAVVEESYFLTEDAALIQQCLGRLKPEFGEILRLRYMEELSYEAIAGALGVSMPTVKSRLFHAKQAMAARVAEMYPQELAPGYVPAKAIRTLNQKIRRDRVKRALIKVAVFVCGFGAALAFLAQRWQEERERHEILLYYHTIWTDQGFKLCGIALLLLTNVLALVWLYFYHKRRKALERLRVSEPGPSDGEAA